MKERIAFWLLKSATKSHLRVAKHLYWLKGTVDESWGDPEKVKHEKKILHDKAVQRENAARCLQRIINIYNASKSV